jgi:hypothetical protein
MTIHMCLCPYPLASARSSERRSPRRSPRSHAISNAPDAIAAVWREIVERHPVGRQCLCRSRHRWFPRFNFRRGGTIDGPTVPRSPSGQWLTALRRHHGRKNVTRTHHMGRRQPRVACWRGRVGKLKLLCILLTAFGIERTVCRLDILEALSGLRNAPSDSEIIGLSFDHQSVSPGRKHEIGDHWT